MRKVLALDIATVTGWAYGDVGLLPPATALEAVARGGMEQPLSGSQRMGSPKSDEGVLLSTYEQWLEDMITLHNPDIVVWEAAFMGQHYTAAKRLLAMHGITEAVCKRKKVKPFTANMGSVRKHFCGVGQAKRNVIKKRVQGACDDLGWTYKDDNEADALAVWHFAAACLTGRAKA